MRMFVILASLMVIACFSMEAEAKRKSGYSESYGGDSVIADFKFSARVVVDRLKSSRTQFYWKKDKATVLRLIDEAKVVCRSNLKLRGEKKDAINYPQKKFVELDCEKFQSKSPLNKRLLSVHEFLHLNNVDDSEFVVSWQILNEYDQSLDSTKSSEDLFFATLECNPNAFNRALEDGANINYVHPIIKRSVMEMAIKVACPSIIEELYQSQIKIYSYKVIFEFNELILRAAFNSDDENFSRQAVETLKILIHYNPALTDVTFAHGRIQHIPSYSFKSVSIEKGENALDFYGSYEFPSQIDETSFYKDNWANPKIENAKAMQVLAYEINASTDQSKKANLTSLYEKLRNLGL